MKEDELSKKALEIQIDTFVHNEFVNGIESKSIEIWF
jgi:hypothetical protein